MNKRLLTYLLIRFYAGLSQRKLQQFLLCWRTSNICMSVTCIFAQRYLLQ